MRTQFAPPVTAVPFFKTTVFSKPMGTATAPAPVPQLRQIEDTLAHLPCSAIAGYRKGEAIYSQSLPPTSLYLVIEGKVKICRMTPAGRSVVVDIYQPDEFFGETAFVGATPHVELAVALEDTRVMSWTISEIEEIAGHRPKLGLALVQLLVQRSMEFSARIESFSVDNIARRLARALIRFSDRLGDQAENGSVRMIPFTHELLSQYVGTSREIVTQYMNQFRREGFLRYSRKGITVDREQLNAWLGKGADETA